MVPLALTFAFEMKRFAALKQNFKKSDEKFEFDSK
jgi:hypothetical protein